MQKDLYTEDHEAFRDTARGFVERYVAPHHDEWEKEGVVDRGVWVEAGKHGLLGFEIRRSTAAAGFATSATTRSSARRSSGPVRAGIGFGLHNDVCRAVLRRGSPPTSRRRGGCPASAAAS